MLLHGVLKRSDKMPEGDIRIAKERMLLHAKRLEGKPK